MQWRDTYCSLGCLLNSRPPFLFPPSSQVHRGGSAALPHLSLLEVGGVQLLFMVNPLAVQRALARSQQLVM